MADTKSAAKAADKKGKSKRKGSGLLGLVFFLILLPFIFPTFLVCLGLAPTLVAAFTDDDPDKSRTICVGSVNFAGVFPFLLDLWQKGQTMPAAVSIILNPESWLIMLGAAAIGYLILFTIPPMAAFYAQNQAQNRLAKLEESLNQLKGIWGPEVATNEGLEQVRHQNSLKK
jgi:hypothetical protein